MPKVVLNTNRPLQGQLKQLNTRYILKKPIDLRGGMLVIPVGSTLEFKYKGALSNGTLRGNETTLKSPQIYNIKFDGTFVNEIVKIDGAFNAETDFWNFIRCFYKADIVLNKDITLPDASVKDMKVTRLHLNGKGHTVTVRNCPILRGADVSVSDVTFDCANAKEHVIYALGIKADNSFIVRNCRFYNIPEAISLCARAFAHVVVADCMITGNLKANSQRTKEFSSQIILYECTGDILVQNNTIKECFGGGIKGIGFKSNEKSEITVENNSIDYVANGGIVFAGGEVWNVTVRNNKISRTHILGRQFEGEVDGAINSAINFHGFRNVKILNNTIANCQNSSSLDFDGSISGSTQIEKGSELVINNNSIISSGPIAFFVIQNVDFSNNIVDSGQMNNSQHTISVSGAKDVSIHDNKFVLKKGRAKSYYPIYFVDSKFVKSGATKLDNNEISTDGDHFVFVNANYSGDCKIGVNTVSSSGRHDGTLTVVNNSKRVVNLPRVGKLVRYK